MKPYIKYTLALTLMGMLGACDRRNDEVVEPISAENFPRQLVLSDGGDGDFEGEDNVSVEIELLPRFDVEGKELEGKNDPLTQAVTLNFEIKDLKGFTRLSDYVKGGKAFYEVDDCTTSEDEDIDLDFKLDLATGKGSVSFPAGVEGIEIELETDEDLFDDGETNGEERGFTVVLTGLTGAGTQGVVLNTSNKFEYQVLDDEVVFGDWEVDFEDDVEFAAFKALFGPLDEDIADLKAEDVDKIEISFGYQGVQIKVELIETEADECDPTDEVNKEIEIESEYGTDLGDLFDTGSGEIEFAEEIEQDNGQVVEFKFEGEYEIDPTDPEKMTLTLEGEYLDEIKKQTLNLKK